MNQVVDRSHAIQNYLKLAEEASEKADKFRNYYKATKLQCESELIEDAQQTFTLVQNFKPEGVDALLKISKLAIMINPLSAPKELEDAVNRTEYTCSWALQQSCGKMSCAQVVAPALALIARRYFQLHLDDKGKHYLQMAITWSEYGGKLIEITQTDLKVVKTCVKGNQLDTCLTVVKKMEEYIPFYEMNDIQASFMLTLAELILPIDKEYGKTLLSKAEGWTNKNDEKALKELERVTQLYNT